MKILSLILFLLSTCSYAQKTEFEQIINNYCEKARTIDWKNNSKSQLTKRISEIATTINEEEKKSIVLIKKSIKLNNPSFEEKDIELLFLKEFTIHLVDGCSEYIELSKAALLPDPPINNPTLELYVKKMDELLASNQDKSYLEQYKLADESIGTLIFELEEQAKKDYEGGIMNPKLSTDIGLYLLHYSKYYYKAFAVYTNFKEYERIHK